MPAGSDTNSRSQIDVGDDAVDLLGHRAVEAPQAGFDVGNGDAQFHGGQRAAIVELTSPTTTTLSTAAVGLLFASTASRRSSTRAVCSAWLPEPTSRYMSGRRMPKVFEENVGQGRVVVLPGMDQHRANLRIRLDRPQQRRDLHEVRPRTDDTSEF